MKKNSSLVYYYINFFGLLGLLALSGCNGKGKEAFAALEEPVPEINQEEIPPTIDPVEILSYFPTAELSVFLANSEKTFGVTVNTNVGEVEYEFILDNVSQQKSNQSFFNLSSSSLSAGNHTLKVKAINELGESEKIFELRKNSSPTVNLSSNTNASISCVNETFSLSVAAIDIDGDDLEFSYFLNGALNETFLSATSTSSTGAVLFTPNCSLAGVNAITIRATDSNGEYTDYSMLVTITNPNSASIDSYSPSTNPTVILSTATTDFIVSASGNPPLSFEWSISSGASISSCNNLSTCPVSGGDFVPGAYVLTATVTDTANTSDSQNFNIVINDKPSISTATPSNGSTLSMNCAVSKNFSIEVEDDNFLNPGQTFTITWYLDGNPSASIAALTNSSVHPITSSATFSPNCSPLLLGNHTISVVVTDGYESATTSWQVNTNYFSEACNNLEPGEICTLAGRPGMRSGIRVSDDTHAIYPNDMIPHPTGGWFISDAYYHVVWFYNSTSSSKTVLGKAVGAGEISVVVGTGARGLGTEGQNARNFLLNDPRGLAYSSSGTLYIADSVNNRIIQVTNSGTSSYFAGGGTTAGTYNTDGVSRTTHRCLTPLSLALDESSNKLFSTCYGNTTNNTDGAIKYFMTNVDEGYTLMRKGSGNANGTIGASGSGRIRRAYSLYKHPSKQIIFAGDLEICQISAISYGDTESYFGGSRNLSTNNLLLLTNNNGCGNTLNTVFSDTSGRIRPYSLAVKENGSGIDGIFIGNNYDNNILFLNTTNSDVTIGGRTIPSGFYHTVFGSGTNNKVRASPAATATNMSGPLGIFSDSNYLYVADRGNFQIITLDHTTANGNVEVLAGNLPIGGYDGEDPATLTTMRLNTPTAMDYDYVTNRLFLSDSANYRIREIDLSTGTMSTTVGRGSSGASNTNPESPFDAYLRNVRDVTYSPILGGLFYSDTETNTGGNRNCLSRFFNESGSTQTVMGQSIPNNRINTVAGNYFLGCNIWDVNYENSNAMDINLYEPWGIVADDTGENLYLSSNNGHCIHHIDSTGKIATTVGLCGTSGDVSSSGSFSRLDQVGDLAIDPDPTLRTYPNFFIVDRTGLTGSFIKYMNNSPSDVTIAGVTIPSGEIGKIVTGLNYLSGVSAFDNQICYAQGFGGTAHNYEHTVTCINRSSGLPTLRIGKSPASVSKGGVQYLEEDEGVLAGSSVLAEPFGVVFDDEGNLYISLTRSNVIKKVKRWW